LWNIARFVLIQLERRAFDASAPLTAVADRWLMTRLSGTVSEVTACMDGCQFDRALRAIREFAWDVLADNYIELVKGRLYSDEPGRDSACRALTRTLDTLCRLMAPFTPHFAEECYSYLGRGSVHFAGWPVCEYDDPDAARDGDLLALVVADIRRYKHERGMALNAPLGKVTIFSPLFGDDSGDAARALNAEVVWRRETARLEKVMGDVQFNMAVIGPAFRKQARAFMDAVRALPPESLENPPDSIEVDGTAMPLPKDAFFPTYTYMEEGEKVDVLNVGDVIVTIQHTA
ncbi:MAG TPA: valine--tRNA ligase, partial [Methanolinea sp.]|nr:valine--tRNA ligase [Methanolinea sp.]